MPAPSLSLSAKARAILDDPGRVAARDAGFRRLEAFFDRAERGVFYHRGHVAQVAPELIYTDPERWVVENLEALAGRVADAAPDDARLTVWCVEYPPYGVHFLDKVLGAEVFFQDGQWHNHHLKSEVGALAAPGLGNNETWSLAKRAARAFVASGVALPLFGTPTLSSALNIGVNLHGQEILAALLENPAAAAHDLRVVNDTILRLHQWHIANVPRAQLQPVISWDRTQPPGQGQVCGCATQLLSGPQYAEFAAPLDNAVLGLYPRGGMIHLCGFHTQHIPALRAMPALRAIQINDDAARDLPRYFHGLRDDQLIYLNPCEGMTAGDAIRITGGDRLVIPVYSNMQTNW